MDFSERQKYPYGGKVKRPEYMFGGALQEYKYGGEMENEEDCPWCPFIKQALKKLTKRSGKKVKKRTSQRIQKKKYMVGDAEMPIHNFKKVDFRGSTKEELRRKLFGPSKEEKNYFKKLENEYNDLKNKSKSRDLTEFEENDFDNLHNKLLKPSFNSSKFNRNMYSKMLGFDMPKKTKANKYLRKEDDIDSFQKRHSFSENYTPEEQRVADVYNSGYFTNSDNTLFAGKTYSNSILDAIDEKGNVIGDRFNDLLGKNKLRRNQRFIRGDADYLVKNVQRNGKKVEGGVMYSQLKKGDIYTRDYPTSTELRTAGQHLDTNTYGDIKTVINAPKGSRYGNLQKIRNEITLGQNNKYKVLREGYHKIVNPHSLLPIIGGAAAASMQQKDNIPTIRKEYQFGGKLQMGTDEKGITPANKKNLVGYKTPFKDTYIEPENVIFDDYKSSSLYPSIRERFKKTRPYNKGCLSGALNCGTRSDKNPYQGYLLDILPKNTPSLRGLFGPWDKEMEIINPKGLTNKSMDSWELADYAKKSNNFDIYKSEDFDEKDLPLGTLVSLGDSTGDYTHKSVGKKNRHTVVVVGYDKNKGILVLETAGSRTSMVPLSTAIHYNIDMHYLIPKEYKNFTKSKIQQASIDKNKSKRKSNFKFNSNHKGIKEIEKGVNKYAFDIGDYYGITDDVMDIFSSILPGLSNKESKINNTTGFSPKVAVSDNFIFNNLFKPVAKGVSDVGNYIGDIFSGDDEDPIQSYKHEIEGYKKFGKNKKEINAYVNKKNKKEKSSYDNDKLNSSVGPYRIKILTHYIKDVLGIKKSDLYGWSVSDNKQLEIGTAAALSLLAENFDNARRKYRNLSKEELVKLAIVGYNNNQKFGDKDFIDNYIKGEDNFLRDDYLDKVLQYDKNNPNTIKYPYGGYINRQNYQFGGPLRQQYQMGTGEEGLEGYSDETYENIKRYEREYKSKVQRIEQLEQQRNYQRKFNYWLNNNVNLGLKKQDNTNINYKTGTNFQDYSNPLYDTPFRVPAVAKSVTKEQYQKSAEDKERIDNFNMSNREKFLNYVGDPFTIFGDIHHGIEHGSQWINKKLGKPYTSDSRLKEISKNPFPTSEEQRMKFALAENADRNTPTDEDGYRDIGTPNYDAVRKEQNKDAVISAALEIGIPLAGKGVKALKGLYKKNKKLRKFKKDAGTSSLSKLDKEEVQKLSEELKRETGLDGDSFYKDEFEEQYIIDREFAFEENLRKENKLFKEIKDIEKSSGVAIDSKTITDIFKGLNIEKGIDEIKEVIDKAVFAFQNEIKYYNSKGGIEKLRREGLDGKEIKEFKKLLKSLTFRIEKSKDFQGSYANGVVTINPSSLIDIDEVIHHEINHLYQRGISKTKNQPVSQKYWDKITFNKDNSEMLASSYYYSDLTKSKYKKMIRRVPTLNNVNFFNRDKYNKALILKNAILENKYNIKNDNIFLRENNPKVSYKDIMGHTGYDEKTSKKLLKTIDEIEYKQVSSEPDSGLAQVRIFMIKNGDIKDKGSHISKKLIKKYLNDYNSFNIDNILSDIEPTESNINYLYKIFKNLKTAVPIIGAGAAAASMQQKDNIPNRREYQFGGPLQ